jgi:hypothetical protein
MFLIRHENLGPYERPDMDGVHEEYVFGEKFGPILLNQIFQVNALLVGGIEGVEHLSFAIDNA